MRPTPRYLVMPTPNSSFRRNQRILTSKEFQRVFRTSRRSRDALFMVRARYSDQPQPRLGLAISKKHARLAVQRNRLKRYAREVFRHSAGELAHADFVVVNQPAATTASADALINSLTTHFRVLSEKKART